LLPFHETYDRHFHGKTSKSYYVDLALKNNHSAEYC